MVEEAAAMKHAAQNVDTTPSCAVLVCSCDAYSDLWEPFFQLFQRHWPDCPFPVYLGAGEKTFKSADVITLHSPDRNWTASFRSFLEQLSVDYVLVLLEDFFLEREVASSVIQSRLLALHSLRGSVLRLTPKPGPDLPLAAHSGIGQLHRQAPYRVSLQPALWNRLDLLALLQDGESAWEFEWKGTERSRLAATPYLATEKAVLHYRHVVERGAWFWAAARKYRRESVACDFRARPVMGPYTAARKALNRMRKRLTDSLLPPALRRRQ